MISLIISIKILIISVIWLNIKLITLFFIVVLYMINKESNNILDQKGYKIGNRFTNFSLKPLAFHKVPEPISIGTILYYAYFNAVFDLTYNKIIFGRRFFWLKNLSLKKIIRCFFFWYIGISRLSIYLIYKVIRYKEDSFENYLLQTFSRPIDDRIIVRINSKWEVNGGSELFWRKLIHKLESKIELEKLESVKSKILKLYKDSLELSNESKSFSAVFININTKIPHEIFPEASKKSEVWPYQTDYEKAYTNNLYNKIPLINKYEGLRKKSILLESNRNEFMQVSKEKKTIIINQYKGAVDHGYNPIKLSKKYNTGIEELSEIKIKIEEILSNIGIEDIEIRDYIFEELAVSAHMDILELIKKDKSD